MSVWYQHDVMAFGNRQAIGKFFNLDPKDDVHAIEWFEFTFGQKNVPGLRLGKIIEQNPDLIFLVKESVEASVSWWIERYNASNDKIDDIYLYTDGYATRKINKKILEEYEKEYSGLSAKHIAKQKGYEEFRWSMFFNFERAARMLANADQYKELVSLPRSLGELERECYNDPNWEEDYSHIEDK